MKDHLTAIVSFVNTKNAKVKRYIVNADNQDQMQEAIDGIANASKGEKLLSEIVVPLKPGECLEIP